MYYSDLRLSKKLNISLKELDTILIMMNYITDTRLPLQKAYDDDVIWEIRKSGKCIIWKNSIIKQINEYRGQNFYQTNYSITKKMNQFVNWFQDLFSSTKITRRFFDIYNWLSSLLIIFLFSDCIYEIVFSIHLITKDHYDLSIIRTTGSSITLLSILISFVILNIPVLISAFFHYKNKSIWERLYYHWQYKDFNMIDTVFRITLIFMLLFYYNHLIKIYKHYNDYSVHDLTYLGISVVFMVLVKKSIAGLIILPWANNKMIYAFKMISVSVMTVLFSLSIPYLCFMLINLPLKLHH